MTGMRALWAILFYFSFASTSSPHSYSLSSSRGHKPWIFVRLISNQTIYLLNRGYRQIISYGDHNKEIATVQAFGFDMHTLINISMEELSKYPEHPQVVPPVISSDNSPDEAMRLYKLKASIMQREPNLLKDLKKIGNFLNPSLSVFHGICISLTVDAPCSPPKRTVTLILLMHLNLPSTVLDHCTSILTPTHTDEYHCANGPRLYYSTVQCYI